MSPVLFELRTRMREVHTDGGGENDSLIRVYLSHPCAKCFVFDSASL